MKEVEKMKSNKSRQTSDKDKHENKAEKCETEIPDVWKK